MPLPFFSSLCCPIAGSGIKSFFTGIDSSSDTAVSSTQLIYSFMSFFFYLFSYFIVFANIFFLQIDRLEPSFTDSVFRFSSYKRMLSHSISPLIIFCHFLINPVTKPLSPKMTENNQSFFSILPDILLQNPKIF